MLTQSLLMILFHLATTALTYPTTHPEAFTDVQIRDKLSLYSIALDTKNFALLADVYALDVVADYGLPPPDALIHGLAENQAVLKAAIDGFTTQETISTVEVDFGDAGSPNSTSYLVANYFGKGNLTGQLLSVYGKYEDSWVLEGGSWKIKERILSFFGPGTIGNLAIMRQMKR